MSGGTSLVAVQVTADSLFASDSEEVLLSALDCSFLHWIISLGTDTPRMT
jgi:hypothetical protein